MTEQESREKLIRALENIARFSEFEPAGPAVLLAKATLSAIAATQAQSQPEGWVSVPIEPTEAMLIYVHRQAWINAISAAPKDAP